MGPVAFAYANLLDSSTLSSTGSWSGSRPLTELQERELALYAQSSTGLSADTQFDVDHGAAAAAQCFGVIAHNLPASGTLTITRGTTLGGTDVLNLAAASCWPFTPLGSDYDGGHFGIFVIAPAETSARYTRFAFQSTAAVRLGRAFVGPIFVPPYNPNKGDIAEDWLPDFSSVDRTESGADWVHQRGRLRHEPVVFKALSQAQASLLHEIQRTHGITEEVVFIKSTTRRDVQQQYGFLGLMRKLSPVEHPTVRGAIALGFDERGGAP